MPRTSELALVPDGAASLDLDPTPDRRALAAWKGALGTGLPALAIGTLAAVAVPVAWTLATDLATRLLPTMLAVPLLEGGFLAGAALFALPLAALASRLVRNASDRDADAGRALAAGTGMVTALVSAGAVLAQATGFVSLVELGPAFAAALLMTGVVGRAAFGATLPARRGDSRVPALYTASMAAGLAAAGLIALAGAADWLALTFPLLDLPRMWLYQALPHPWNDAASMACILGSMAPVTYGLTRLLRGLTGSRDQAPVEAGVAVVTLSPVLSMLAYGAALTLANPGAAINHAFLALGALAGALPNLLAIRLARGPVAGKKQLQER